MVLDLGCEACQIFHIFAGSINNLLVLFYCATGQKVAGSIPDGVIGIFH
jgi:hypothetical protein